jgi:hypothetical protein
MTNNIRYDNTQYNDNFLIISKTQNELANKIEINKLNEINQYYNQINNNKKLNNNKNLINMSLNDILIEWYLVINKLFSNIINFKLEYNDLLLNNSLFFIGLTFILLGLLLQIISKIQV